MCPSNPVQEASIERNQVKLRSLEPCSPDGIELDPRDRMQVDLLACLTKISSIRTI